MDLDRWTEIAASLRNNRLRTLLTAAGVFWGMFMLVAMLGFGDGLERGVMRNFQGVTNAVFVWGGRTSMPYAGLRPGRPVSFDNADAEALRRLPEVDLLAPRNRLGGWRSGSNVSRGNRTGEYAIMGDMPEIFEIAPIVLEAGRLLNPLDIRDHRKVAVIGKQVKDELFAAGEDPVGDYVKIRGVYFQVVGVFRSRATDDRGDRDNQSVYVPFSTFQRAFNFGDEVGWFALTGHPDVAGTDLEAAVEGLLAERHDVHPEDDAIGSWNAEEEFSRMQNTFTGIRLFVWFVGTMTLAAGVVGVSNIMLIVVRERTREIGLRRAIGATPLSIVVMIVQEAVVLTAVAGYSGLVAGVVLLEVAGAFLGGPDGTMAAPTLDLAPALIAGGVLLVAGALAGVIPARNAATIEPVVALHAE